MQALRHYLLAVQFFTRIPVTGRLAAWVGYSPDMLRASAAHFPGVGWLAATLSCAVFALLHQGLGAQQPLASLVAAVLCTVATVLMTGGFHEDGLADVADGLGGSAERERALDIMKDSRIGAYGAMALVLVLLAKTSLLAHLGTQGAVPVLAALAGGHVLSRWWPLLIIRSLPHVGDSARSKSKPLADQISGPALVAALLWCFPPLVIVGYAQSALFLVAPIILSALCAAWMARWFARRLQGFTGDCLETLEEISQEARHAFLQAGGREFHYIPCLNDQLDWMRALSQLVGQHMQGWPTHADQLPSADALSRQRDRALAAASRRSSSANGRPRCTSPTACARSSRAPIPRKPPSFMPA